MCGWAVAASAQAPAAKPAQMQVVAVVGCVTQQAANWLLTNATGPIVAPVGDGKVQTGSSVTVEKAKSQAPGSERYRLINALDEFGLPTYNGQRVLVKGLIVGDAKERRINMVSIETVSPTCGK
jgi:hypothetical protein